MLKNVFILISPIIFLFACSEDKRKVERIIHNAVIYSVDSSFTIYEAMAIDSGKIVELGSSKEILNKYSSEQISDEHKKTILPGFIDAHCHFTGFATDMWKCNLTGTNSFEEVISKITTYSENAPMHWIYGRGWDQNDWKNKEYPDKKQLDELFPDRPVFLKRVDGHAALVNQKALDLTGVNATTKVDGGMVELKNGKLTGILLDNAMDLVDLKIPLINDSLAKHYYQKAQEICFKLGLTQVHDCGVTEHTINLIDEAQHSGKLKMKIYALLSDDSTYYERWLKRGIYKTERLTVGGFKIYSDGALGSRGACLIDAYNDKANWHGFLLTDKKRLERIANTLINSPFQFCTHAIGDSANRYMLNLYGSVLKGKNNRRWRIEHAQVLHPADFYLFKEFDVIPSVQPTHATSDMYWAEERVGKERVKTAYAYKQLLTTTGLIALGTDFPVEDISPLKTFFAAVARQDSKGFPENGFQKENALTREETLRGMTIWAAYASFEEKEKGSLEKNKTADFIILDTDIMKCELNDVLKTKIISTYINGECVYNAD
jgi:predicted amidohydrolase YtcJ